MQNDGWGEGQGERGAATPCLLKLTGASPWGTAASWGCGSAPRSPHAAPLHPGRLAVRGAPAHVRVPPGGRPRGRVPGWWTRRLPVGHRRSGSRSGPGTGISVGPLRLAGDTEGPKSGHGTRTEVRGSPSRVARVCPALSVPPQRRPAPAVRPAWRAGGLALVGLTPAPRWPAHGHRRRGRQTRPVPCTRRPSSPPPPSRDTWLGAICMHVCECTYVHTSMHSVCASTLCTWACRAHTCL